MLPGASQALGSHMSFLGTEAMPRAVTWVLPHVMTWVCASIALVPKLP
jgi:hypothetical protein